MQTLEIVITGLEDDLTDLTHNLAGYYGYQPKIGDEENTESEEEFVTRMVKEELKQRAWETKKLAAESAAVAAVANYDETIT